MNYLPTNIKYLRTRRKVSQANLSLAIGKCKSFVSQWEDCLSIPQTDDLKKISDFFEVSIDWLVRKNLMNEPTDILKANYQLTKQILETYEK